MQKKIDLHIHSTASDGEDSAKTIIQIAHDRRLDLISITDHDSVAALEEASIEAKERKVGFVTGVELSVTFRHPLYSNGNKDVELHLLGYGFDPTNRPLIRSLEAFSSYRIWRAGEIVKRVNAVLTEEQHPNITEAEFDQLQKTIEGSLGRPHLARLLIAKGIVTTKQEAFDRYLVSCDVPKKHLSLNDGATLIRDAGGIAVLAHPCGDDKFSLKKITNDIARHAEIIESMRSHIDGIECFYWNQDAAHSQKYVGIAKKLRIAITAGSDHHGGSERDRMGRIEVPPEITEAIFGRFQTA